MGREAHPFSPLLEEDWFMNTGEESWVVMTPILCPPGIHSPFNSGVVNRSTLSTPIHSSVFPSGISLPLFQLSLPLGQLSDGFYSYENKCVYVVGVSEVGILVWESAPLVLDQFSGATLHRSRTHGVWTATDWPPLAFLSLQILTNFTGSE